MIKRFYILRLKPKQFPSRLHQSDCFHIASLLLQYVSFTPETVFQQQAGVKSAIYSVFKLRPRFHRYKMHFDLSALPFFFHSCQANLSRQFEKKGFI